MLAENSVKTELFYIFVVLALLTLAGCGLWYQIRDRHSRVIDRPDQGEADNNPASNPAVAINDTDGAEMVYIPAGEFTMGSNGCDDEKPVHKVYLDDYYIYKNPVTVQQYVRFCAATGRSLPLAPGFNQNWSKEDHPMVNVSWDDAQAYCKWVGAQLPTEAQWEKAARGTDGRAYPWGNQWDRRKCANSVRPGRLEGTKRVGSFPAGASPFRVLDMAGNVWQWCSDWYDENYY